MKSQTNTHTLTPTLTHRSPQAGKMLLDRDGSVRVHVRLCAKATKSIIGITAFLCLMMHLSFATPLPPGAVAITGFIAYDTQEDRYTTTFETGITYHISVANGSIWDTVVTLYAPDGSTVLTERTTVNGGESVAIDWSVTQNPGTYFIAVKAFAEFTTGSYTIAANWDYLPAADQDDDGVPDWAETDTGVWVSYINTGSDPAVSDSDGDHWNDWAETRRGTDPNNPLSFPYATKNDFDGDGKADLAVFWPAGGQWYILQSSLNTTRIVDWGWADTQPVAEDFDGDGITDVAVYWPAGGNWYIMNSAGGTKIQNWGWNASRPAPADFDGDHIADFTVFYDIDGTWYIQLSHTKNVATYPWGWGGTTTAPADFDGDGQADPTIYWAENGMWYIRQSSNGTQRTVQWGWEASIAVPADYDGDHITDIAVYWPIVGNWYILRSSDLQTIEINWGWNLSEPVPNDYDGDQIADIAVFDPATGNWYIRESSTGQIKVKNWGWSDTIPIGRP